MRLLLFVLLSFCTVAAASDTLRVGSRVLVTGDSAARVVELLGKPSAKQGSSGKGRQQTGAQRWQYRRGSRITDVVIVDGKVAHIDERRQ